MLARARFWLLINVYAIVLDCVGVVGLVIALSLSRTWPVAATLCGIVAGWILYGADFSVDSVMVSEASIESVDKVCDIRRLK